MESKISVTVDDNERNAFVMTAKVGNSEIKPRKLMLAS